MNMKKNNEEIILDNFLNSLYSILGFNNLFIRKHPTTISNKLVKIAINFFKNQHSYKKNN